MDKNIHLNTIIQIIETTLQDHKAEDIEVLQIGHLTSIADYMVIATGTSSRHLNALYEYLRRALKEHLNIAKQHDTNASWLCIGVNEILIHLMTQESRDYYRLESLWNPNPKN